MLADAHWATQMGAFVRGAADLGAAMQHPPTSTAARRHSLAALLLLTGAAEVCSLCVFVFPNVI